MIFDIFLGIKLSSNIFYLIDILLYISIILLSLIFFGDGIF